MSLLSSQTTCRQRPLPTKRTSSLGSLEISHASRLRRKLCGDGDDKLVINVWGVGYRLLPGGLHRIRAAASVR